MTIAFLVQTAALLGGVPSLAGRPASRPGLLLAHADAPLQPKALTSLTREQLNREYESLRESRPTLEVPVTMLVIGLVGIVPGLGFLLAGSLDKTDYGLLAVGALILVGAGALVVLGVVKLVRNLREQKDVDRQSLDLRGRMRALDPLAPLPPLTEPLFELDF
jgi:hypothetical protein